MKWFVSLGLLSLCLAGGCPNQSSDDSTSAVTAQIAISATSGEVPLTVSVSGAQSTSTNAGEMTFAWDFDDNATAQTVLASHTYTTPGLYTIVLRVTDAADEVGTTSVDVRVQGTATPVAVIEASTNSGFVPLGVVFDGSGSYADDDVIRDYYWDFGDGSATDRRTAPAHSFEEPGVYTVTLRVVTAGGLEATTTTTITAGASVGSLQFDGTQMATLTAVAAETTACTFEAWFKAAAGGGTLVGIGGGTLSIEVDPADNEIRFQIAGTSYHAAAANLSGLWRHVALAYDGTGNATLYLDGAALTTAAGNGNVDPTALTLGLGFAGKIADVRWWSVVRTAAQISAAYDQRLSGSETGLIGYWRLDDGSGQSLSNDAGPAGVRGTSQATEASDPAWSTDGPDIE
ncbi:MAG: PKD domain-containing protein [Phycisphaerae bacterium]|jgi:PKD repeat protein